MRSFTLFTFLFIAAAPSLAAGPLLTETRQPMYWRTSIVRYTLEPGSLGSLSSYQAKNMVKNAFSIWQDVDTATVRFVQDGELDRDVNAENVMDLFSFAKEKKINPIIFDDDGAILDLVLGSESAKTILGLTQSSAAPNGQMTYAWVILNGRYVDRNGLSAEEFFSTVVHELGHFIGLGHTQLFRHLTGNNYGPDDRYIPVLFPISTDDETERTQLTFDDRASVSISYPASSFSRNYGEIRGKVVTQGERSFPGVNVVARKVDDPMAVATSCVSDYLRRGTGEYRLAGLPPGEYLVWAEPIDPSFHGTSQVGPYADTPSGLSFVRVPRAEFYNGEREALDENVDNRSDAVPVSVKTGQIVKNVDFHVNRDPTPEEEQYIQILTRGQTETGAVEGRPGYRIMESFQFLFVVSDDDDLMQIEVETEQMPRIQLHIRHEARVSLDEYDARSEGLGRVNFKRSRDGSPPLKTGRYFIGVANNAGRTIPYTITVTTTRYDPGDLNRDGKTDSLDLYHFSSRWQETVEESGSRWDLARDPNDKIDAADLRRLLRVLK